MQNFNKIKRQLKKNALLKSGCIGGGVGVAAACLPLAIAKLMQKEIPETWVILGGLALGALVFGVLLLCLYPFQRRLARKLDRELGTRERVQTMVEFAEDENPMAALQRKDTEERISQIPSTFTKLKNPWHCLVACCLAVASLVGALAIPAKPENPGGGGDSSSSSDGGGSGTSFEATDFQLTALWQLIDYVRDSKMEQSLKTLTVEQLVMLVETVPLTQFREDMVVLVTQVIQTVDQAVEDKNSGFDLATAINATENESAQKLASAIGSVEIERFTEFYKQCSEDFKDIETAQEKLSSFSIALTTGLVASKVAETDGLYVAVTELHKALVAMIPEIKYYQQQAWATEIESVFTDKSASFNVEISQQIANDETRDYVIRKLKEIFGLSQKEMPELSKDYIPSEIAGEDENTDKPGGGGLGTGDYNFPSDELVYDPATGEQKRYGELLMEYYGRYEEALQEGRIDPDLEKILQMYFDSIGEDKEAVDSANQQ